MGKRERIAIIVLMSAVLLLGAFLFISCTVDASATEDTEAEGTIIESYEATAEDIENNDYGEYIIQGPAWGISDEERELAERVVAAEARGESMECMMAVAQTIRDRCITREQTVTEVLTAANQFAAPYEGEITDRIKDAVSFTFDDGISTFDFPVTHFYASYLIEAPDWTYEMEFLGEIDGVSFYRQ